MSKFAARYLWLDDLVRHEGCEYGNRYQSYYETVRWLYATALIGGNYA